MSSGTSKRFQSGREIFRTCIPNYDPPSSANRATTENPAEAGAELASSLLQEFSAQLTQLESKLARNARQSVEPDVE